MTKAERAAVVEAYNASVRSRTAGYDATFDGNIAAIDKLIAELQTLRAAGFGFAAQGPRSLLDTSKASAITMALREAVNAAKR